MYSNFYTLVIYQFPSYIYIYSTQCKGQDLLEEIKDILIIELSISN